ncbi:hypothetical protein BDF21DRAFT_492796 [Thamnidium elegans]|nr:hypothetical protein BDF21DRAFT_492796 [Thamnidium elegans]
MTEYAIPPIMLTPTQSTHAFQRRSSIRRGTIASISKDVRVKDFVEIIKKQKALHQQERNTETDSVLLKRRHSMMNMNKSIYNKPQQQQKHQDHRTRTLSNNDLKGTVVWQQTKQQQQQQTDSDKIRLGEDQGVLYHHLRKCAACLNNNECFSSEQDEEEEEEENSPSPSTSSSSNDQDTFPWQQSSLLHNVEQREQIIKNLNSSMTSYSAQIKELSNRCYNNNNEEEYKLKIENCKSLVAQQELLLNQLYYQNNSSSAADIVPKTAPTPPLEKNSSSTFIKSICNDLYKGFKSTTTGITIKQKQDKNEADTIISVQGVCTTIERSLIPDTLLVSNSPDQANTTVYQHHYSLDITHSDRQTKFKLLLQDQWQKDVKVNTCSFKHCNTLFNWFQRKHHCRACGEIYCNTHSGNRLPLFSAKETHHPVFSRVCDTCFYSLANHSLY